jgi:hypothetical protein
VRAVEQQAHAQAINYLNSLYIEGQGIVGPPKQVRHRGISLKWVRKRFSADTRRVDGQALADRYGGASTNGPREQKKSVNFS